VRTGRTVNAGLRSCWWLAFGGGARDLISPGWLRDGSGQPLPCLVVLPHSVCCCCCSWLLLLPVCHIVAQVRAGVRNPDKADTFLEIASSYGLLSKDELGRLTVSSVYVGLRCSCWKARAGDVALLVCSAKTSWRPDCGCILVASELLPPVWNGLVLHSFVPSTAACLASRRWLSATWSGLRPPALPSHRTDFIQLLLASAGG